MLRSLTFILVLLPLIGHAQDKKSAAHREVEYGKVLHISYASPSWNADSTKIDSAFLILRDKTTGKIARIQLEETEPDSSQFQGRFSVSMTNQGTITPEIYIPPKDLRNNDAKLLEVIKEGKLPRKPVIWTRNEKGQPLLDVYDTRDQAEAALKAYEETQRLEQEARHRKLMSDKEIKALTAEAEHKAQLEKAALEAAKREQDRIRLEQLEKQKAAERAEAERRMTEEQRAKRREQAEALNAEALEFYNKGEYSEAESRFKKAVELDHESKDYYYKYGVTLYRLQKFNDALVALKMANVRPEIENEKKYFMGLVYYRLGELDNGLQQFGDVAKSNDPNLGPSGMFYAGVILYTQEKYDPAKKQFENVIDTSKDPKLDDQAEAYIDRVASAMAFQKMREKRWTFTGTLGLMYDSNILLSPDNSSSEAQGTGKGDFRLLTVGDIAYRALFTEKYEFVPHFSANLTNSAKSSSAPGDPFLYDLAAPWSWKGTLGGKVSKLTLTPGYELLWMDPTDTGTKHEEMASYFVGLDESIVYTKSWVSTYSLQYRHDQSYDLVSEGDEDLTSNQYTIRTTQTLFLDQARKQALLPMVDYVRNSARGKDKTYAKYDLGITYARPAWWGTTWNLGLTFYQSRYTAMDTAERIDNDYTVSTGVSKPIKDWIIWGLSGSYTRNGSTDANFEYTKYLVLTTATFVVDF